MNYKKAKSVVFGLSLIVSFLASTNVAAKEEAAKDVKATRNDYITLTLSSDNISLILEKNELVTGSANVNVKTSHYSGFTLSFNTKNDYNSLKNPQKPTNEIPSISESTTASNFPNLGWGCSFDEDSAKTFRSAPLENTTVATSSTFGAQTYPLTVGAKVDGSLPQGAYDNALTFTAVTNPLTIALCNPDATTIYEAVCMQDMNASIVGSMPYATEFSLVDSRDQKSYSFIREHDDSVIMIQNLDLDITNGMTLTDETTDLNTKKTWTPNVKKVDDYYHIMSSQENYDTAIAEGKVSANDAIMYELGDYYYNGGYQTFNYATGDPDKQLITETYDSQFGSRVYNLTLHEDQDLHECYFDYEYDENETYYRADYNGDYYYCDNDAFSIAAETPLDFQGRYYTNNPSEVRAKSHIGNLYSAAAVFAADNIEQAISETTQVDDRMIFSTNSICPRGWKLQTSDSYGYYYYDNSNSYALTHPIYTNYILELRKDSYYNDDFYLSYWMPNFKYSDNVLTSAKTVATPGQVAIRGAMSVSVFSIDYYGSQNHQDYFYDEITSSDKKVEMTVTDFIPTNEERGEFIGWVESDYGSSWGNNTIYKAGDKITLETDSAYITLYPLFENDL
ncbi:MAG: hypothetical protein MJZ22_00060 [Candidatus Saccharibacteria bacterium]|nr:hypothetical protein [Candidatus Saccharibacteria bacterium]